MRLDQGTSRSSWCGCAGEEKLEATAIYTEVTIRQLQELHARCHLSARPAGPVAAVLETGRRSAFN